MKIDLSTTNGILNHKTMVSSVCMKLLDTVHIWYCSSLEGHIYILESQDMNAQIRVDTQK